MRGQHVSSESKPVEGGLDNQRQAGRALKHEVRVVDAETNLSTGGNSAAAITNVIKNADVGVVLISESKSEWAKWEVQKILDRELHVIPVVIGHDIATDL